MNFERRYEEKMCAFIIVGVYVVSDLHICPIF